MKTLAIFFFNLLILSIYLARAQTNKPLIIAHRGFPALFPENSVEGYIASCYLGADYIETNVQITSDQILVLSYDPYLSRTTDIAQHPEFADRKSVFQGRNDWWIFNFTLAELKTLKLMVGSYQDSRPLTLDELLNITSLEEMIVQALAFNAKYQGSRNPKQFLCGLQIEARNPKIYRQLWNIEISDLIMNMLIQYKISTQDQASKLCPVILSSFDVTSVESWHYQTDLDNVQYVQANQLPLPIQMIAAYATTIAFPIDYIFDNTTQKSTGFVEVSHQLLMKVQGWGFIDDFISVGSSDRYEYWIGQKILQLDAIISDFPGIASNEATIYSNLTTYPLPNDCI